MEEVIGRGLCADLFQDNLTEPVNHNGHGDAGCVKLGRETDCRIRAYRKCQTETFSIRPERIHCITVLHGEGKNGNGIRILVVGFLHVGKLHLAGPAPGCKEVDEDHLFFGQNI